MCSRLLVQNWKPLQFWIATANVFLIILVALTAHTTVLASFINYDEPTEYLVYAHGGRGIKDALDQIEELSYRTTDSLGLEIAFDNESTYPYWWYLRNYPNQRYFGENPTRDLRNSPAILVGNNNYAKLEPIVPNRPARKTRIRPMTNQPRFRPKSSESNFSIIC